MAAASSVTLPERAVWWAYALALLVLVLDQGSKAMAQSLLEYARPVPVLSWFNLTLHYNEGAAFSFLSNAGCWQHGSGACRAGRCCSERPSPWYLAARWVTPLTAYFSGTWWILFPFTTRAAIFPPSISPTPPSAWAPFCSCLTGFAAESGAERTLGFDSHVLYNRCAIATDDGACA